MFNKLLHYMIIIFLLLSLMLFSKDNIEINIGNNFIKVDSGAFLQGDSILDKNSGKGLDAELPTHEVIITKSYLLSKYEITNKQFCNVMNWGLEKKYVEIKKKYELDICSYPKILVSYRMLKDSKNNTVYYVFEEGYVKKADIEIINRRLYPKKGRENYPVIHVTWFGAVAFCNFLSLMDDLEPVYILKTWVCNWNKNGYRLPTESEWEFAARGGNESKGFIYSGSNAPNEVGHYFKNNDVKDTIEVNSLKPNELGFYNMSGNVKEWCWDFFSYYTDETKIDPRGPSKGTERVYRGGAWNFPSGALEPNTRDSQKPFMYNFNLGFRIAKIAD